MSQLLSKEETIQAVEDQIENCEYDLRTSRSPRKKKSIKGVLLFFKSLQKHLSE